MIPLNGPTIVVILAVAVGSIVVPPIVHVAKVTGHAVCHVITLGHKCK